MHLFSVYIVYCMNHRVMCVWLSFYLCKPSSLLRILCSLMQVDRL